MALKVAAQWPLCAPPSPGQLVAIKQALHPAQQCSHLLGSVPPPSPQHSLLSADGAGSSSAGAVMVLFPAGGHGVLISDCLRHSPPPTSWPTDAGAAMAAQLQAANSQLRPRGAHSSWLLAPYCWGASSPSCFCSACCFSCCLRFCQKARA